MNIVVEGRVLNTSEKRLLMTSHIHSRVSEAEHKEHLCYFCSDKPDLQPRPSSVAKSRRASSKGGGAGGGWP